MANICLILKGTVQLLGILTMGHRHYLRWDPSPMAEVTLIYSTFIFAS